MPVIVVGADTPQGTAIVEGLLDPDREIRAFVSDEAAAIKLREKGVKVALGDVSDDSHIEAATARCHTAVLVTNAIEDGRDFAFAKTPDQVLDRWASAAASAKRVIWVHSGLPPEAKAKEIAIVDPDDPELVAKVIALDDARVL
jgi:uncharacterized protein YbjT (DUF2867 family)